MRRITKSIGFLVFNPMNDDYLAVENVQPSRVTRSWCSHPSSAKVFDTRQLALDVIRKIISGTDKILFLAEISENSKQYAVTYLLEVSFSSGEFLS